MHNSVETVTNVEKTSYAVEPDHVYSRHLSAEYRSTLSVDMSTDTRPTYRQTSTDGSVFCFCATDLCSEKLTSEKNPFSGRSCTVGKLGSVISAAYWPICRPIVGGRWYRPILDRQMP